MYIRALVEQFLSPEDAEEFARWAFGDEYVNINFSREGHIYWNKLHKDLLDLKEDGQPIDDIPKMIKLWKAQEKIK